MAHADVCPAGIDALSVEQLVACRQTTFASPRLLLRPFGADLLVHAWVWVCWTCRLPRQMSLSTRRHTTDGAISLWTITWSVCWVGGWCRSYRLEKSEPMRSRSVAWF